jgi:hypothetical protein
MDSVLHTIQFKLLMRSLTDKSGKVIGWDEEVPTITSVDFQWILETRRS